MNEAANGLAGSNVPLSVLPGGCTNVVCRMLGIPTDVVDATEHLLQLADDLEPRRIDLGRVNGRYFVFSSGVGHRRRHDALGRRRTRALKARGGDADFTLRGAAQLLPRLPRPARRCSRSRSADERVEGVSAIVQNSDPYTYFRSTPDAGVRGRSAMDNGTISMTVMRRASLVLRRAGHHVPAASRAPARLAQHRQASSFPRIAARARSRSLDGTRPAASRSTATTSAHSAEVVYEAAPGSLLVIA